MAAMRIYIAALTLLAGTAYAQPCAVAVHVRLHSYDGLVEIDNACLSAPAAYGNGALVIEAIDFGDRVFRGNMEIWP